MPWPTATSDLHWWSARDLASAIRARELSAREVVSWHLDRIATVNPRVNAVVSLRTGAGASRGRGGGSSRAHGRLMISVRCTDCRLRSRTSRTRLGSGRRTARSRLRIMFRMSDSLLVAASASRRARSSSARRTRRSSAQARTRSTTCLARRVTRGRWIVRRVAAAAGPGLRSPPGWCRSRTGPTTEAASATRHRSTTWSASVRRRGSCRTAMTQTSGTRRRVLGPMARTVGDLALMLTAISEPHAHCPLSHGDPASFRRRDPRSARPAAESPGAPTLAGCRSRPEVLAVLDDARDRLRRSRMRGRRTSRLI